jgi:hypothetical protein
MPNGDQSGDAPDSAVALSLEERVAALEADRARFLAALRGAAEMCLKNPMVVAMIPKQMKEDLRKYIDA